MDNLIPSLTPIEGYSGPDRRLRPNLRERAAGYLAFLVSVVRSGEQLSADEEEAVQRTIAELTRCP